MVSGKLEGLTVLVAEDDPDFLECLVGFFSAQGARVVAAENGKQAFDLCLAQPVDVILSDFRMPGGDGLSFLRAVRARNPDHPPFVFLSGFADITRADALREGAQELFDKPCDLRALTTNLLSHIKPAA